MIKKMAPYNHSLIQIPAMIPAEPSNPVMIRWVRLLYLEMGDFTKSIRECCQNETVKMMDQKLEWEVVYSVSKHNTIALVLERHSGIHIPEVPLCCPPG